MRRRICYPLLIAIAFCVGPAVVYASYPPTLSMDRVPREDWTYGALALLASRGLIPGVQARRFYGDWLYTRRQMAEYVAAAVETISQEPDEYKIRRPLLARLVDEFQPELDWLGVTQAQIDAALRGAEDKQLLALSLQPRYWYNFSDEGDDNKNIIGGSATFIGSRSVKSPLLVLGVSNQKEEFRAHPSDFPYLQNAFVQARWHGWNFKFGQEYLWWGPAYSGSLLLSDNAPPFTFFWVGKDLSCGKYIGRLKFDQFFSRFDDDGDPFYLAGRRLEKTLSDQWDVSLQETAKMSKTPNPLIFVIPSLYIYQLMFLDDVDSQFNYFISGDVAYHFNKHDSAYAELLIDDLTSPNFLTTKNIKRPRRIGWLAGIYHEFTPSTSLRAEYIFTDPLTYIGARPEYPKLSYTNDGYIIGHQVGPNSKAIYLRAEQRLSTNLDAVVEYMRRNADDPAGVNPEDETSYDAFLSYGLKPATAFWLRGQRFLSSSSEGRVMVGVSHTF